MDQATRKIVLEAIKTAIITELRGYEIYKAAAERATDIDIERARRAIERARERLDKERGAEDVDFRRAEGALQRAIIRLKIAEKHM